MKIKAVINICHGGFGISLKAAKRLHELGEPPSWKYYDAYLKERNITEPNKDWYIARYYDISRLNKNLVKVVEELKDEANGDCARLEVVEIDVEQIFENALDEYDGYESLGIFYTTILTTERNS